MPRIQHKRGTSANLASVNPTPLAGELVWDSTENAIKIGDGATAWTSLAYVTATPRSHNHDDRYYTESEVDGLLGGKVNTSDSRLSDARTPTAHKATHATGGSDALTPSDIGAAPAASPVFSGNVGIGTSPTSFNSSFNNVVIGNGSSVEGMTIYSSAQGTLAFGDTATTTVDGYRGYLAYIHSGDYMVIGTGGAERFRANASGVIVSGVITVAATSGSAGSYAPSLTFSGDANTGFGQVSGQSDTASVFTAGHERVRVRADGNVGIGGAGGSNIGLYHQYTLSSASTRYGELIYPTLASGGSATVLVCAAGGSMAASSAATTLACFHASNVTLASGASVTNQYGVFIGSGFTGGTNNYGIYSAIASGTGRWNFYADSTANNYFAGNVGIGSGRTSPATALDVNGVITVSATSGSAGSYLPSVTFSGDPNTGFGQVSGQSDTASIFTAGHERVRVTSGGNVGIGTASPATPGSGKFSLDVNGPVIARGGVAAHQTSGGVLDLSGDVLRIRSYGATAGSGVIDFRIGGGGGSADAQGARLDASANFILGSTVSPTGSRVMMLVNGTAPSASIGDCVMLYSEDVSSSAELKVRDEAGNVTTLSPHNFDLIPEGPSEPMAWAYYSERDGHRINVDMLRLARLVERLTGEKLVYEAGP